MDDDLDYELSQLDLSVFDQEFNLLSNSDAPPILDIDIDDTELIPRTKKNRRFQILSDSEDESIPVSADSGSTHVWFDPLGKQTSIIPYTECPGIKPFPLRSSMSSAKPEDFYSLLVSNEIFEYIAEETNRFASQILNKSAIQSYRLQKWVPTDCQEIKRFFGVLIWMGLVKLPQLAMYWSTNKCFEQPFVKSIISRNRFEVILRMLHFANNEMNDDKKDRLFKVRHLLDMLNANFKFHYTPNEEVCVDESLIPFRGRVIFRQYNKNKRHKYGIKLFKLCSNPGYTVKVQVYAGKNYDNVNTTPTNVVLALCDDYLNKGHTVCTDNWYTSLDLARKLLAGQTHLIGTLRKNRRGLPQTVVQAKLKADEFSAQENGEGITVMKWKDKRDVLLLSTKHSVGFRRIIKKGKEKIKPKIVVDYNHAKSAVDLSDQMSSYTTPLRKTIKWPTRLAMELLLNTAVVNSYILYKLTTKKKITVVQFRTALVEYLVHTEDSGIGAPAKPRRLKHELKKKQGLASACRKYCFRCYKENCAQFGRTHARNKTKRVVTYCGDCENEPHYCINCFNLDHRYV